MNILLINLPYKTQIIRRYSCTYYARGFLFPPLELLYVASNINQENKIKLIDCIAKKTSTKALIQETNKFKPNIIITLVGIEAYKTDIETIDKLKKANPQTKIIAIGYYPTIFPVKTLENSKIDVIIKGEPELIIQEILQKDSLDKIPGICYKLKNKIINNKNAKRITNLDKLKFPNRKLIEQKYYKDIFNSTKFTTILASRGCKFNCPFCIQTYGTKYIRRTNENIILEIKKLRKQFKIKNLRFMDDTFNTNRTETIKLCQEIIKNKIKIKWSCLCRIDLLDETQIKWMKKAGCYRIYAGIESLDKINNKYTTKKQKNSKQILKILKKNKIERIIWFMVGFPQDTKKSIQIASKNASKLDIDFAIVSQITPYPGTKFFSENKNAITFSLKPYKLEYNKLNLEKEFYKNYYFNFNTIIKTIKFLIKHPITTINLTYKLVKYMITNKNSERDDFI